jgi:hypothetical protein
VGSCAGGAWGWGLEWGDEVALERTPGGEVLGSRDLTQHWCSHCAFMGSGFDSQQTARGSNAMQQVSGVNVYVSVVDVDCGGGRGDVARW